jgi:hypothetical protein
MSRFTEKPMARAHEHLASARYAEAAGAFRAVLRIDPNEFQAHFGLADALMARGQRDEAVEGLVGAAESCSAREDHAAALTLYGKALSLDPVRLELHLDVAMAEAALGRMEAAQSRLENLAEVYMQAGRTDEAAEVYRCLAGWEDGEEGEVEEAVAPAPQQVAQQAPQQVARQAAPQAPPAAAPPAAQGYAVPAMMPTTETVVIPTILVTPDGQLLQVPIEQQQGPAWRRAGDSIPPIPAELLEVAHSAPIDLAAGEEIEDVERTVVAFPPPPPSLPEEYESAAHPVDRAELEAAVVAAMDNLAQLEEEDMTLIMQRLPPQSKVAQPRTRTGETRLPDFVMRSRAVKREPEPALEAGPMAEDAGPESKMRVRPAPRPVGRAEAPAPTPGKPAVGKTIVSSGAGGKVVVSKASAPTSAGTADAAPARASAGGRPTAAPSRASAPTGAGKPAATPARAGASARPSPAAKPATMPARSGADKPAPAAAKSPAATNRPAPATSKPATATVARSPAATSKPAPPTSRPGAATSKPTPAPSKPAPATSKPAPAGVTGRAAPEPAPRAQPGPSSVRAPARGAMPPKPTRPDNPLAERLRRRAGLQKPDAAPGRPTEPRGTEPISVRSSRPTPKK